MTLQVSNIAGDGRHVVKPRDFPRHAEVYAPPDNWRRTNARKDYKEPDHSRDTVHGGETGGRRNVETPQVTSITGEGRRMVTPCGSRKMHGYAVWLPRRARWTGLMKWIRACVVDPSLGVHFSPTSHGEDGCFVPPQVACARTE